MRQAHCETSEKLHCAVISDPVFVSFADASWANRRDFGSQCGYLCVRTERALLDGSAASRCPISWHSCRCPRVARSSGSAEPQAATQAQEETEFIRLFWLEIVLGGYDDTTIDQKNSKVGGCLIIDAKGVFDAIHRSESAALFRALQKIGGVGSCLERSDWKKPKLCCDGVTAKRNAQALTKGGRPSSRDVAQVSSVQSLATCVGP